MTNRNRPGGALGIAIAALWIASLSPSAAPGAETPRGVLRSRGPLQGPAPPFHLADLDGNTWSLETVRGAPAVLIFGDLANENTRAALAEIQRIVERARAAGAKVHAGLVAATKDPPDGIRSALKKAGLRIAFLRDVQRSSFAAYRVIVLPTTVIIGSEGRVVTTIAGRSLDLGDRLTDALLLAAEKIDRAAYERARTPVEPSPPDEEKQRAVRHARLAERLVQRGFPDLAGDEFRAALQLDPNCVPAHVGWGRLLLIRKKYEESAEAFRKALAADPSSVGAELGVATIQILRGGEELDHARLGLERVLQRSPGEPEALFLMGRIAEATGKPEEAIDYYRRAAIQALRAAGRRYVP